MSAHGARRAGHDQRVPVSCPEILAGTPRLLLEGVQRASLAEAPISRFGLLNVITRVAHTTNTDPEVRFAMESAAGTLLAA
jgi:hypothetical protein